MPIGDSKTGMTVDELEGIVRAADDGRLNEIYNNPDIIPGMHIPQAISLPEMSSRLHFRGAADAAAKSAQPTPGPVAPRVAEEFNQQFQGLRSLSEQGESMPQEGMPQEGMPPQGMPQEGMPPQGMPPQGMPPQGMPPQAPGPAQAMASGGIVGLQQGGMVPGYANGEEVAPSYDYNESLRSMAEHMPSFGSEFSKGAYSPTQIQSMVDQYNTKGSELAKFNPDLEEKNNLAMQLAFGAGNWDEMKEHPFRSAANAVGTGLMVFPGAGLVSGGIRGGWKGIQAINAVRKARGAAGVVNLARGTGTGSRLAQRMTGPIPKWKTGGGGVTPSKEDWVANVKIKEALEAAALKGYKKYRNWGIAGTVGASQLTRGLAGAFSGEDDINYTPFGFDPNDPGQWRSNETNATESEALRTDLRKPTNSLGDQAMSRLGLISGFQDWKEKETPEEEALRKFNKKMSKEMGGRAEAIAGRVNLDRNRGEGLASLAGAAASSILGGGARSMINEIEKQRVLGLGQRTRDEGNMDASYTMADKGFGFDQLPLEAARARSRSRDITDPLKIKAMEDLQRDVAALDRQRIMSQAQIDAAQISANPELKRFQYLLDQANKPKLTEFDDYMAMIYKQAAALPEGQRDAFLNEQRNNFVNSIQSQNQFSDDAAQTIDNSGYFGP